MIYMFGDSTCQAFFFVWSYYMTSVASASFAEAFVDGPRLVKAEPIHPVQERGGGRRRPSRPPGDGHRAERRGRPRELYAPGFSGVLGLPKPLDLASRGLDEAAHGLARVPVALESEPSHK